MKKILIGLLGIISLGLINFSSAGSYTYTGTVSHLIPTSKSTSAGYFRYGIPVPIFDNSYENTFDINCSFSNLNVGNISFTKIRSEIYFNVNNSEQSLQYNVCQASTVGISDFSCSKTVNTNSFVSFSYLLLQFEYSRPVSSSENISFDYSCTFSGSNIIDQSKLSQTCPTCPTCPGIDGQCSVSDKIDDNLLYTGSVSLNNSSYTNIFNYGNNGAGTYCVKLSSSSPQTLTFGFTNSSTGTPTNLYQLYNDQYGNWVCLYGNKSYFNAKLNSSSNTVSYEVYKLTDLLSDNIPCSEGTGSSCDYSDYILISDVTKNYCTNKFSDLIPEEDITQGYCETEFGLIDPENCPASGGTGDINRSTFWVNNTQIQGASSIYLYLPDFLSWDYTYINTGSTLQIDVENEGDQDYINNILDIQSYHPDKDQFAMSFAGFLTLLMPYIIITLFIIFVWKLIRRIFR